MSDWRALAPALAAIPGADVAAGAPMAPLTSLRLGGPADLRVRADTEAALVAVLDRLEREGCPVLVVGQGTNLLVTDEGIEGAVLMQGGDLEALSIAGPADGAVVTVGAAASVSRLLREVEAADLCGLEYLTGIPGSVGGAVAMNAGTLHGYVDRSLVEVRLAAPGGMAWQPAAVLGLGYRHAEIPAGTVIAGARLSVRGPRTAEAAGIARSLTERRRTAHPPMAGTAGSFFKNPDMARMLFAGELIERAGLKGFRHGGAYVSPVHANFLSNGGDRSADLLELAEHVRRTVLDRFGVTMTPEVRIVGRGAGAWRARLGMEG